VSPPALVSLNREECNWLHILGARLCLPWSISVCSFNSVEVIRIYLTPLTEGLQGLQDPKVKKNSPKAEGMYSALLLISSHASSGGSYVCVCVCECLS